MSNTLSDWWVSEYNKPLTPDLAAALLCHREANPGEVLNCQAEHEPDLFVHTRECTEYYFEVRDRINANAEANRR